MVMDDAIQTLLKDTAWDEADIQTFPADWSSRYYARVTNKDGKTAILLKSPPDNSPQSVVGHKIGEWVKINHDLKTLNLNVPTLYAQDLANGIVLMEDFGNDTIANKGIDAYMAATDVLISMNSHQKALDINLIKYEKTHVYNALSFFPEYILQNKKLNDSWLNAWRTVEQSLPPCPRSLTHIDFGAANLMWLPDREGTDKIGILDFQAACDGPFVYDMVNLLDDARRTIPDTIKQSCINHYCATLQTDQRHAFHAWYPVIAAQFHARVLGQIMKLKAEKNRDDLMQFFDPLLARFQEELNHSSLAPISNFIKDNDPHDRF